MKKRKNVKVKEVKTQKKKKIQHMLLTSPPVFGGARSAFDLML